ncbi:hypothetical protein AAIG97_32805, partial [Pseudomonas aeruginosa]
VAWSGHDAGIVYLGMAAIAVGNGLFKANPSSLLSTCYEKNDPRLDGAFTMYYMSVNIGSFFRESAFPAEAQIHEILNVLSENDGLTLRGIEQRTNLRYGQIEKALKLLVAENP